MFIYLTIEDVIGNAFVRSQKRNFYYYELDNYGSKVAEILNREKDTIAYYTVSKESQRDIYTKYPEIFKEYSDASGVLGVSLKENITPMYLWSKFCAVLSIQVLDAFQNSEATILIK